LKFFEKEGQGSPKIGFAKTLFKKGERTHAHV